MLEAQDNMVIDLRRMIKMIRKHIGMPSSHGSQNTRKGEPEEREGTRDGDDSVNFLFR